MERETVNSSTISSIGYDPDGETLEVVFHKTGTYLYFDVPSKLHRRFLDAPSKGVFFNANIKDQFRFERPR